MLDLLFPREKKCLFCERTFSTYEIIPFCPSCVRGLYFSGIGPGIIEDKGIIGEIIQEAARGREELIDPLAWLLFLDFRVRGLKGSSITAATTHSLDPLLTGKLAALLHIPENENDPGALIAGLFWDEELRENYPPGRILILIANKFDRRERICYSFS